MLESIAKETHDLQGGKSFTAPVTIASVDEDLKTAELIFNNAIDYVGDPYDSLRAIEMLRDDLPDSPTSQLISKLDRQISSTVPSPDLSPKNRLKSAAEHALHMGHFDLFNQIYSFIIENGSKFETPEDEQAEFLAAVDMLVKAGLNAKEKK